MHGPMHVKSAVTIDLTPEIQCIAVALENYFSHSLQSLVPILILCTGVYAHGHETLQGTRK